MDKCSIETSSSDLDGTAHVCVWVEGDGTRSKWCLETLKVIGSEAAALRKKKCYQCPVSNSMNKNVSRRWKKKKILSTGTKHDNSSETAGVSYSGYHTGDGAVRSSHLCPAGALWQALSENKSESIGKFHPGSHASPPAAGRRLLWRRQVGSAASRVPPRHSGLLCVPPHCSICIVWVNSFVCVCPWRDQGRVGNKTNFPAPAAPHCLHLIRHIWMDITDNNALHWPQ